MNHPFAFCSVSVAFCDGVGGFVVVVVVGVGGFNVVVAAAVWSPQQNESFIQKNQKEVE